MLKEIVESKETKDVFDDMFKDFMKDLEDISKMIDDAIKKKDKKKLDHISKVLADTQKKIGESRRREAFERLLESMEFLPTPELKKARKEMEKELKLQKYDINDYENKESMISILYYTICYYAKIETDGGETRLISFIDKKYGLSNPFDEKTTLHLEDIAKPYAKKIKFSGKEIDDDTWSDIMGDWYPAFDMKW